MKKYTLTEMQIKLLEKLQQNHSALFEQWKKDNDPSLEATMSDYMCAQDIFNHVFSELIEEELWA